MTDIRERLARAMFPAGPEGWKIAHPNDVLYWLGRADLALAHLPLTQAQLDGLASGDMVVVPKDDRTTAEVWSELPRAIAKQEDQHHD